jgi:hypothetical protein
VKHQQSPVGLQGMAALHWEQKVFIADGVEEIVSEYLIPLAPILSSSSREIIRL